MKQLAFALALTCLLGCERADAPAIGTTDSRDGSSPLIVYTVNYPLAYFAERIAGEFAEVRFPAPADLDPAHWSPTPETIADFQTADLVIMNGAGYAAWMARASLRRNRLVDTSSQLREELIVIESPTHQHGPKGAHSHGELASTIWLDPLLASRQARAIAGALSRALPERAAEIATGLASLEADLRALDVRQRVVADRIADQPLLFSHPVYQYLIARYGLNAREVAYEPDVMPSESEWRALGALLAEHQAEYMLWEAEPSPGIRERLRDLGVRSRTYRPLGNRPVEGDYLSVMARNATQLESLALQIRD